MNKKRNEDSKEMQIEFRRMQIFDFTQFIDILNVLGKYDNVNEVRADIIRRKEQLLKEIYNKETQIFDISQFIDVLDAIQKYDSIEKVKWDIETRKKMLSEDIKQMQNSIEKIKYSSI